MRMDARIARSFVRAGLCFWGGNTPYMYEQKQLFDFILDRVEDTASENGLKHPQAFGRWFASIYFDKPQHFSISDGCGDGKVDLFFGEICL
jgi:hypothetical protein